jgi:hypothetical protein
MLEVQAPSTGTLAAAGAGAAGAAGAAGVAIVVGCGVGGVGGEIEFRGRALRLTRRGGSRDLGQLRPDVKDRLRVKSASA